MEKGKSRVEGDEGGGKMLMMFGLGAVIGGTIGFCLAAIIAAGKDEK